MTNSPSPITITPPPPLPPPPSRTNMPPIANAGSDQWIMKPLNVVQINGSLSYDPDGTIFSYQWRTITGPTSIKMWNYSENAKTYEKFAGMLEEGIYQFELMVIDDVGTAARDTMEVTVLPDSIAGVHSRMKRFNNLQWGDSCSIRINNVSASIPSNTSIQVFIRGFNNVLGSSGWIRVSQVRDPGFWYQITNDVLIIHAEANLICDWDTNDYDVLVKWN